MNRDWRDRMRQKYGAIWAVDAKPRSVKAYAIRLVRLIAVLARDVRSGHLTLRSMSLVYTTLLSIVPLLALSFSVLKAFGVHNQIEPMLMHFLAPLGSSGDEITQRILQFIQNMNVGVLGTAGLAFLIYTAISLMQKVEESFNFIWHISHPRSLGERFSRYLSVLLIGPLLIFSALGITATILNSAVVREILAFNLVSPFVIVLGKLMPYLLVIGAFTFVYSFIPNTRVRLIPALTAGIIAGILWQSAGWAFAVFVATSTRYSAIYSSFAVLMLFMIWLYVSWLILLFGASVAFYLQHSEYLIASGDKQRLSSRMNEQLALAATCLISKHYADGQPPWTPEALATALDVPMYALDPALNTLRDAKILTLTEGSPPAYLPLRDLAKVSVGEVLAVMRSSGEDGYITPRTVAVPSRVRDISNDIEHQFAEAFGSISIASLAQEQAAHGDAESPIQTTGVARSHASRRLSNDV